MRTKAKVDRAHYLFDNKMLVALIIPLIIEQLLAVLVGMVDSIMIAAVGEAAVSGVSLIDQIMILLINIFGALATGGVVVAGQYLGQKKEKEACRSCTQLVWFVLISSVVITLILYGTKNLIIDNVFGQITPEVRYNANLYYMIVMASVPFIAIYNAGAAVFRAMGNSKVPMQIAIIMNVINIAGNAVFIYGFHMGTEGVAIPTLVSRVVAAAIIIVMLLNQELVLHVQKTWKYRADWKMIKNILSVGVPNGLENSIFHLGKLIVLSLVSTFGTYAIAANAVTNAIAMIQYLSGFAICHAVTTVIARCVGAGDYEQVTYYAKKLVVITYVSLWVVNILVCLGLPIILDWYNLSPQTEEITRQIVLIHAVVLMLIWPFSFVFPAVFRATGDAKYCMVVSVISMWTFRIGFSYILGGMFEMGVLGIWVAMLIDWAFRAVCFSIRYMRGKWKKVALVS